MLDRFSLDSEAAAIRDLCEGLAATRELAPCCLLVFDHVLAAGASWAAIWETDEGSFRLVLSAPKSAAMATFPGSPEGIPGAIALGLARAGKELGVLGVGPPAGGGQWPKGQIESWRAVSHALALAWSCIRLDADLRLTRRELGKRELDLGTLFGISQELNSSLSTRTIAQTLLFSAMGHCALKTGLVTAVRHGEHRILAEQGLTPAYLNSPALAAAMAGKTCGTDDPAAAPWGFLVPIHRGGEILGLLGVGPKVTGRSFSKEEASFLQAMAEQAAIALANATYCEDLQDTLERERQMFNEKEKMRRYLSAAAMAHVEAGEEETGEGSTIWATILFADVRGFTPLAEKLSAQAVIRLLNTYMSRMAGVILDHGGVVDKFMGDGIMAFFQPEYGEDNEAYRAASCAVAMRQEVAQMNAEGVFGPGLELHVGIGLNSGEAVAGNIGSPDRMDFTLIGDAVNLSARLESAARPGQILLSTSTVERLYGLMEAEYLDTLVLKGRAVPLDVYQLPGQDIS